MGVARILSGGTDGRYSVELDFGSAIKTQALAALATIQARIDADILALQVLIDEANAKEQEQILEVLAAQNALILLAQSGLPPGSPELDTAAFNFEVFKLRDLQTKNAPLRLRMETLKAESSVTAKRIAYWNALNPIETRGAWCADFTENGAIGSYVSTMDIPGESDLIVLYPGCRAWTEADGILTAREVMSPAQVYFNAAILPGWQRHMPTYRWGTVTAVDFSFNTLNVSLAPARSSAQSLNVNEQTVLNNVEVDYMGTGSIVFREDDRVVVQFRGQSWDDPYVIGFLDNPRPAGDWKLIYGQASTSGPNFNTVLGLGEQVSGSGVFDAMYALALTDSLTVDYRVNRGAWAPLTLTIIGSTVIYGVGPPGFGQDLLTMSNIFIPSPTKINVVTWPLLVSAGAILEVRVQNFAGDLLLNCAVKSMTGSTPVEVSLIGVISGSVFDPCVRADYVLFQSSGD